MDGCAVYMTGVCLSRKDGGFLVAIANDVNIAFGCCFYMSLFLRNYVTNTIRPDTNNKTISPNTETSEAMKNLFAFTLIVVSTIVMASTCEAFQGRPNRQGPPGERGGQRGGPGGERGGPGGRRGERGGPSGERGGPGSMQIPIIKALDADKDGKISSQEMANAATALATLDKNGDGVLERDEMMPPRRERGERGERGGRRGQGGPRGGEGGSNGFVDRMMQNDTDGDGKISADEAPERMQGFFDRLDGDKDGFLTKEEITEASNRWSGGGGRGGGDRGGDSGGKRPKRPASE